MKKHKRLIIVLSLIGLLAVVLFVYAVSDNKENSERNNTPTTTESSSVVQEPTPASDATGAYVDYSDNVIANTNGTKVLFFHAQWCPQCRALDTSIKSGKIPANTTIIKVDYDNSQDLRKKYGVTLQTTLVRVDDNGNLVKKYVAYDDPTLSNLITNVL